jgi:hypothetical protein
MRWGCLQWDYRHFLSRISSTETLKWEVHPFKHQDLVLATTWQQTKSTVQSSLRWCLFKWPRNAQPLTEHEGHYCVHRRLPLVPAFTHANPIHSHICLGLTGGLLPSGTQLSLKEKCKTSYSKTLLANQGNILPEVLIHFPVSEKTLKAVKNMFI